MTTPPVLLLLFRRSDLAQRLIDSLRPVQPPVLYIAADGPRPNRPGEELECLRTRAVVATIDWPCRIETLYRSSNLGVRRAVSEAIDWFFSNEEAGIILEEDCLPHPDFFPYCDELLDRYADNSQVMHISGTNYQPRSRSAETSYFFSRYNHVWGWATWKRAWRRYRGEFEGLSNFLAEADRTGFWESARERRYWNKIFAQNLNGEVESWAYRWTFTLWAEGGLCIYPEANLVSNVGFGAGATNTNRRDRQKGDRPYQHLGPLVHPQAVQREPSADHWTFEHFFWGTPWARFSHRLAKGYQLLWIPVLKLFFDLWHQGGLRCGPSQSTPKLTKVS
jgi:hypothetical protein